MICELISPIYSLIQGICPVLRFHPPRLLEEGDLLQEAVKELLAWYKLRAQGLEVPIAKSETSVSTQNFPLS
jgi:hypothetical protein